MTHFNMSLKLLLITFIHYVTSSNISILTTTSLSPTIIYDDSSHSNLGYNGRLVLGILITVIALIICIGCYVKERR